MDKYDKRIDEILDKYLSEAHFTDKDKLNAHYNKHVLGDEDVTDYQNLKMPEMSIDEYDDLADSISRSPAAKIEDTRNNRYIGYTSQSNKYVKYDTKDEYIVVYTGDPVNGSVSSLYKQPIAKFKRKAYTSGNPDFRKKADLPKEHSISYNNVWKVKYTSYDDKNNAKYTSKEYFINADYEDKAISKAIKEVTRELDNEAMDYTVTKDRAIEVHDFNGDILEVRKDFEAEKVEG